MVQNDVYLLKTVKQQWTEFQFKTGWLLSRCIPGDLWRIKSDFSPHQSAHTSSKQQEDLHITRSQMLEVSDHLISEDRRSLVVLTVPMLRFSTFGYLYSSAKCLHQHTAQCSADCCGGSFAVFTPLERSHIL